MNIMQHHTIFMDCHLRNLKNAIENVSDEVLETTELFEDEKLEKLFNSKFLQDRDSINWVRSGFDKINYATDRPDDDCKIGSYTCSPEDFETLEEYLSSIYHLGSIQVYGWIDLDQKKHSITIYFEEKFVGNYNLETNFEYLERDFKKIFSSVDTDIDERTITIDVPIA